MPFLLVLLFIILFLTINQQSILQHFVGIIKKGPMPTYRHRPYTIYSEYLTYYTSTTSSLAQGQDGRAHTDFEVYHFSYSNYL